MKHYRIVRIAGVNYQSPMVELHKKNPELPLYPYAEQQKVLFNAGISYSDSFSRAMKALGHEADEIVFDLETLQKTWARENGIKYDPDRWQHDIILSQIETLKPDIIYFQATDSLPLSIRRNLKTYFPFVRLVVVHFAFPIASRELEGTDILLVGIPSMFRQYQQEGFRPHLVYHYYNEAILESMDSESPENHSPKYDFTFIGSSGFSFGMGHQARYWTLVELIQRTCLELWVCDHQFLPGEISAGTEMSKTRNAIEGCDEKTLTQMLRKELLPKDAEGLKRMILQAIERKRVASIKNIDYTPSSSPIPPLAPIRQIFPEQCHDAVFGIDMYRILRESKVTFNKHTDAAQGSVGNMRLFEASGVGTCLLSDSGANMSELFEEDHEVVTYSSTEECIEKLNYLLQHDDVRSQIAAAGQKRTLNCHTAMNRCQQIDDILQASL